MPSLLRIAIRNNERNIHRGLGLSETYTQYVYHNRRKHIKQQENREHYAQWRNKKWVNN